MSKKDKVLLEFTGACEAEYWDEKGPHLINPGDPPVAFTPEMAKFREAESCWKRSEEPTNSKKKGGE